MLIQAVLDTFPEKFIAHFKIMHWAWGFILLRNDNFLSLLSYREIQAPYTG